MAKPEQDLQKRCVAWMRETFPEIVLTYVNNNSRNIPQGRLNKSLGIQAGFPDLAICSPSPNFHGLFVELKSKWGRLSPAQRLIHDKLRKQGYLVVVIHSLKTFKEIISGYLGK